MNTKPHLDYADDFVLDLGPEIRVCVANKHIDGDDTYGIYLEVIPEGENIPSDITTEERFEFNASAYTLYPKTIDGLITKLEELKAHLPALSAKYRMLGKNNGKS